MAQGNVELHRRLFAAFNARDINAFVALCDPEVEFHSTVAAVGGGIYHGHDGLRRWHREFEDAWGGEIHLEAETYLDLGDHTLVFYRAHGRGDLSGAQVTQAAANVVRWRHGLCVHSRAYLRREDALRDLGVSEDSLEPIKP